jgi:hypothetical protein
MVKNKKAELLGSSASISSKIYWHSVLEGHYEKVLVRLLVF